jgi:hypothetical protein
MISKAEYPEGFVEVLFVPNSSSSSHGVELMSALLVNAAERVAMLFSQEGESFSEKQIKKLERIQKDLVDMAKKVQFPPKPRNAGGSEEGNPVDPATPASPEVKQPEGA